jgi:hypothetical protein
MLEPTYGDAPRLRAEAIQKISELEHELAAAPVALASDVTGTWIGTIDMKAATGRTSQLPAYLVLKQQQSMITGTGGSDAS